MGILIPILAVTVIGILSGAILCIASSVMAVKEDDRLAEIRECLPGANCGACGFSGCDGYAKALLENGTKTNLCVPGADAVALKISQVLGVEAEDVVEQVAVVKCSGSCQHTHKKYDYEGMHSCAGAKLLFAGDGACAYGCLGLGDCAQVCPQSAITVENGVARVNQHLCIGCGLCAKTCPNGIIAMIPDIETVVVRCSNRDKGAQTRKDCNIGCIGCKKCEKVCAQDAIHVIDNLAQIDYDKCIGCRSCVGVCMTHCLDLQDFTGAHKS